MFVRQNARQIRERHFYNGTTLEMVKVREILNKSLYIDVLDPVTMSVRMTFPKYKIKDRVKEVRKAFNPNDHNQTR